MTADCDHRWTVQDGHLIPMPWVPCSRCHLRFGEWNESRHAERAKGKTA